MPAIPMARPALVPCNETIANDSCGGIKGLHVMTSSAKGLVLRPGLRFNGVEVFTASMRADREALGERITRWIADHPAYTLAEINITQSSDASFHCVSITVFYYEDVNFTLRSGARRQANRNNAKRPSSGLSRRAIQQ